jgi:hypothetical protein
MTGDRLCEAIYFFKGDRPSLFKPSGSKHAFFFEFF